MRTAEEILLENSSVRPEMITHWEFNDSICANHALKAMKAYAKEALEEAAKIVEDDAHHSNSREIRQMINDLK